MASQILKHIDGGDISSALVLPRPECDDAGRPVWHVTDSEISKAFRKRSLAVHPDKNPSAEAKQAFDKLNDAVRSLRDPTRKGEALRRFADRAFKEKCRADPTFTERAKKARNARTRWTSRQASCGVGSASTARASRRSARRRWRSGVRERSPDEESVLERRERRRDAASARADEHRRRLETDGDHRLGRARAVAVGSVAPIPTRTPTTPGWRGQCSGTAAGAGAGEAKARGSSSSERASSLRKSRSEKRLYSRRRVS